MKIFFSLLSLAGFLLVTGVAMAEPKVVYRDAKTTSFKWEWPPKTRKTEDYVQTKPYYYTGRILKVQSEDVSRYRHHYRHKTHRNSWGYFFKPGTKLVSPSSIVFGPLQPQNRMKFIGGPRY